MGNACAFESIRATTTGGNADGARSQTPIPAGELGPDDPTAAELCAGDPTAPRDANSSYYCKAASTIVNDVNVRKDTVRVDEDARNPGFHLVSFAFDAIVDGWICIAFRAREGRGCRLVGAKREIRVPFARGLGQRFEQAPGTGVDLASLSDEPEELSREGPGGIFPLLVRAETASSSSPSAAASGGGDINAQLTHAVLDKDKGADNDSSNNNGYAARVVKQTLYVRGARYELREIYGVDHNASADADSDPDLPVAAKECVICLTEPRDTAVLPCRHMCMCSGCATVLRFQSNRCPICRAPVERLLQIRRASSESS